MTTRRPIPLTAVAAAFLLATTRPCRAGEVSYLETFDAYPYSFVVTNLHASYLDWRNGDLSTALNDGVLQAWENYPAYNPTNTFASLKSLVCGDGLIQADQDLELRADILRLSGEGACATLGWQMQEIFDTGYLLMKGTDYVALVKHRFDRGIFAPLLWQQLEASDRPVTLVLQFRGSESGLGIQVSVLDTSGQTLFNTNIVDTPASDPVFGAPTPLESGTEPGAAWSGTGKLTVSLFGANTNVARLEMDVDNIRVRQTLAVTIEDTVAGTYTNAARQKLSYRLFVPTNQPPGAVCPLVLYLHSGGNLGDDNIRQFYEVPWMLLSPARQARHPCFLVAPQVSPRETFPYPGWDWYYLRDRVMGVLTNLMMRYPIDPDRIYVIGGSLGAVGTWCLAQEYPDFFAAAVPDAGYARSEIDGAPSDFMKVITRMPIWAFHGAKDRTIPVDAVYTTPDLPTWRFKADRGTVADLRKCGGVPIYTEYAYAGHGDLPYEQTPIVADWLMAQRRGQRVQSTPWISVTTPNVDGVLKTSYTNLDLTGTACTDAGITGVLWRNESMTNKSGMATGTTNWAAPSIPLIPGRVYPTRIVPRTNIVTVTATGTSWSDFYGGTTTFNAALQVVHIPVRLRAALEGNQTRLDWTGAAPLFVLQRCTDLGMADWQDVSSTVETNFTLPHSANPEFYRIKLP